MIAAQTIYETKLNSTAVALTAALVGVALSLVPVPVQAQDDEGGDALELPSLQLQRFQPAPGPADYITVWGTGISEHMEWTAGAYFNYGTNPMQLGAYERPGERTVSYQANLDFVGTLGLYDLVELGVLIPWTMRQRSVELQPILPVGSPSRSDLPRTGLNDLRLTAKYQWQGLHEGRFGLSFVGALSAPTGRSNALTSDGGFGGELLAVGEYVFAETIRTSANLGFRYRPGTRQIRENILGNEVTWGLAAHAPFFTDDVDAIAELSGAFPLQSQEPLTGITPGEVPVEIRGALRYGIAPDWSLTTGMSAGMGDGIGAPRWRFFAGISGKWATGGWWNVNYRRPRFQGRTDPCDPRIREQQLGRLRFDPTECPDHQDGWDEDEVDTAWLDEPVESPDPEWMDRIQEDGTDEEGGAMLRQGAIIITEQVTFETGSADLTEESFAILDDVAALINRHDDIRRLRVEGHTDNVGGAGMNLELSEARSESVRQYLITMGVDADRVQAVGYGESRPVADNDTAEGRAKNRRVEFNIMEMDTE